MSGEIKFVRRPGVRGGSLTLDGTRMTVTDVVRTYRMYFPKIAASYDGPPHPSGFRISIESIADQLRCHFQTLSGEQVRAALVYWYEHEAEVQDELDEEDIR